MPFDNKIILITGGTGSFGQSFTNYIFKNYKPKKVIIFSRDEMKQWNMAKLFEDRPEIRFFIGDVRDEKRLRRAMEDVNFVVHAAAMKIVPIAERDPFEVVKTNILGSMNIIDAAIDMRVEKVVALSTDKASSPINLYGATKLASDKLFIAANSYSVAKPTVFSVVRYGNVIGSRGSVIPFFLSHSDNCELPITDRRMTRFMITLEQGIDLVKTAFCEMIGGELFIKKIPSMNIIDIAKAVNPNANFKDVGIRQGEKLHEEMISVADAINTYEYYDHFRIMPSGLSHQNMVKMVGKGKKVSESFNYSSDKNPDWMTTSELSSFINENKDWLLNK